MASNARRRPSAAAGTEESYQRDRSPGGRDAGDRRHGSGTRADRRLPREPARGRAPARGCLERGARSPHRRARRRLRLGAPLRRERFGPAFTRLAAVRLHRISGGNPFLALEIARALVARGTTPTAAEPLPVPSDVGALVATRPRTGKPWCML